MEIKLSSSTGCYNLISIDVENQDFVEYMKNTKSTVANPIPIAGNIITKTKDELGDVPIFEEGQTITVELLPKNPDHNPVALFFCELRGNYDFNINYDLTSTSHDISSSIWLNYFTEADGNNTELLPAPNGSLFIYPKIGADNKNTTTCNIKVKDFTFLVNLNRNTFLYLILC